MEGDDARRSIWLVDVPLAATHHLRNSINTGKAIPREVLEQYEIPIVASALKLYLLELPGSFIAHNSWVSQVNLVDITDSLVSSQVYEIIKTIYSTPDSSTSSETRISVLQNTLGQLRLANIATLDAITTHFTRLIELTSADEPFIASLAQILAPCVLRPRQDTPLTMHERHSYRLLRDLFAHKEAIFGELKRASTLSHTPSGGASSAPRLRAISTDESNRRANMEARNRAIASKSRASSPAPHANGQRHRRERSSGPADTRFPIQTSPMPVTEGQRKAAVRASLEVPAGQAGSPVVEKHIAPSAIINSHINNNTTHRNSIPENDILADPQTAAAQDEGFIHGVSVSGTEVTGLNGGFSGNRDSLTRKARYPARKNAATRGSTTGEEGTRPVGVQLVDKPMDD